MAVGSRTLDLQQIIRPDNLATQIAETFQRWEMLRNEWLAEKREIRNYLFAVDTNDTTNANLPWKNSTHMPKLTQIRDNLHANYMAALFPNDRPIVWEGDDEASDSREKRESIEGYMYNKMRLGKFQAEMSKIVYDYIDYGNCFGMSEYIHEKTTDPTTGEITDGFVGPKAVRISPLDLVFNPTAANFESTPKILRSVKTLGSLRAELEDHPENGYLEGVFKRMTDMRHQFTGMNQGDVAKSEGFQIDGFSSFFNYITSDYVEILDFYGDYYDRNEDKLYKNYLISLVDRSYILRKVANPSWLGTTAIRHCGWRPRPDNLYAMGPLDNLVGMQYRIDHLENAKADAFDLIIHPVLKIKGLVEDFDYGPGERIYIGDDGDVEFERPDVTMLNADTQIAMYEAKMEEMAGAPKQAMGFRTPGEKTAYEVQILENGSNRIFLNRTGHWEEDFSEPLLNDMLESGRRNIQASDLVRVVDDQYGAVSFMTITKEDITARGKIRPVGARHFARNANIVQNLTALSNSPIGQDPAVLTHISGKKTAYLMEELLGLERYHLVQDNIRVAEAAETAQQTQAAQQVIAEKQAPNANSMVQQPTQGGSPGQIQGNGAGFPNST